jgi:hypothetical protein
MSIFPGFGTPTPAGYDRMDLEAAKMATTDKERELSKFQTGDKTFVVWNTTAMDRMAQERNTPSIAPPLGKPGVAKVRKKELKNNSTTNNKSKVFNAPISSAGKTKRPAASRGSRVAALLQSTNSTKTKNTLG